MDGSRLIMPTDVVSDQRSDISAILEGIAAAWSANEEKAACIIVAQVVFQESISRVVIRVEPLPVEQCFHTRSTVETDDRVVRGPRPNAGVVSTGPFVRPLDDVMFHEATVRRPGGNSIPADISQPIVLNDYVQGRKPSVPAGMKALRHNSGAIHPPDNVSLDAKSVETRRDSFSPSRKDDAAIVLKALGPVDVVDEAVGDRDVGEGSRVVGHNMDAAPRRRVRSRTEQPLIGHFEPADDHVLRIADNQGVFKRSIDIDPRTRADAMRFKNDPLARFPFRVN